MWIRSVADKDLAAIRTLLQLTWHATYDGIYGADKVEAISDSWHSVEALRLHLGKPYSEFVVADDGKRILGVAFASLVKEDVSQLHQLYVHPDAQGQGTGTALLMEMESAFPSAAKIRLEVERANTRAIDFYSRRGYQKVGHTSNCGAPQSGITALILEKALEWQ